MVIIFVFSTSNYTLWNLRNRKSSVTYTEKTPKSNNCRNNIIDEMNE